MINKIGGFKLVLLAIVALLGFGYGGYKYYQESQTTKVKIETVKVETGDIKTSVSATGTIKPVNSVDINSKISGRIVEVLVKENDWVTAGQKLFMLDDQQYRNEVIKTQATLDNAALTLERMRTLWQKGAVAKSEYDVAEKDYRIATANYAKSVSDFEDTIIKAPVTGLVVGKPTPAGQTVAPGISTPMVLMTIADMSIVQSETLVDETDIGQVALGQKVEFTVDAYSDITFHGVVSLISRKAQTENNVIYYKVYVDVADSKNLLFPDMTSRATIHANEVSNVLTVPISMIRENSRGRFVYKVMPNGKTQEIAVETGLRSDSRVEIKSGVNEGDQIVQRPASSDKIETTANNSSSMSRQSVTRTMRSH